MQLYLGKEIIMFCGNCGNKIEDNVKFCPSCGAPIQTDVQPAAPVQEHAAEPVVQAAAPVIEQAAEPAAPVSEPAPAPAGRAYPTHNVAEDSVHLMGDVPMIEEPAAPAPEPAPVQPEAPVQQNAFAQPAAPVQQPVQPEYQPAAPVTPKKKKGKAGLIAGVTAAAVVAGGAGVGYFCFHDDITHLVMGDKEYAKMVDKMSFIGLKDHEDDINGYTDNLSSYIGMFANAAGNTSQDNTESSSDDMALRMLGGCFGVFDNGIIPDGTLLESESTVNVELGSVFALADNDTTKSIIEAINSSKITSKIANGETDLFSAAIIAGGNELISGELYTKDGGMLIALPSVTDKTVYIPKEKFDGLVPTEEELKKRTPDKEELKRIRKELAKIYYDSYDSAQIKYTDNSIMAVELDGPDPGVTAKGNLVSITLTGEQIEDVLNKCKDFLKNDEYLRSYFKEAYDIDNDKYEELFKQPENTESAKKPELTLDIEHLVDVHNNVLATRYKLQSEDGSGTAMFVGQKNNKGAYVGITAKDDLSAEISLVDKTENNKDGKAVLDINVSTKDKSGDFRFDCSYTGKGTAKFTGDVEVPVGNYVVTLSDPDKFTQSVKDLLGMSDISKDQIVGETMSAVDQGSGFNPDSLIKELKKFTLTLDSSVADNVHTEKMNIAFGDIGSIEFGSRTEKKSETVTMPDTAKSVRIDDEEAMSALSEDVVKWAGDLLDKTGISNMIGGMFGSLVNPGGIIGTDTDGNPHYAAYTQYMEYEADSASNRIYDSLKEQVGEAVAAKGAGLVEGRIKLYYKNGKPEVIDDGGFGGLKFDDMEGLDSVYAEVLIDSRFSNDIVGVTTVFTDDKYDIPNDLPGVFNYCDNLYPWETTNMIDDYVVGTYPYIYTGEPFTTEYPAAPYTKEELDDIAYSITGNALKMLGPDGDLGNYKNTDSDDLAIELSCDKTEWTLSACYENGYWTGNDIVSGDFTNTLLNDCRDIDAKNEIKAVLYFKDGKLVGTAAFSGSTYIDIESRQFPKADDFKNGTFAGWDENAGKGYIKYYDDLIAEGTYCLTTHGALGSGSAAVSDPGASEINGTWFVTTIDGKPYEETMRELLSGLEDPDIETGTSNGLPRFYFVINGSKMTVGIESLDIDSTEYNIEPGEFDGKPAYKILDSWGDNYGWFIPDEQQKTAQVLDTLNDSMMEVVWESSSVTIPGKTAFGTVKQDVSIEDVAGKWHTFYDDEDYYLMIGTNYVAVDYDPDDMYFNDDDYVLMNPNGDGFDCFESGETTAVIRITYSADTDTLSVMSLQNDNTMILERTDTLPAQTPYLGTWQISGVEGQSIEDYVGQNDIDIDDIMCSFIIGEYVGLYTDKYGYDELWTVFPTDDRSFNLAYDSSLFIEMKLSDDGSKLNGIMRVDDSNETVQYEFVRVS